MLTHQDSNLERQNQNLLCYHYTMGQNLISDGAKVMFFLDSQKHNFFRGRGARRQDEGGWRNGERLTC